MLNLKHACVSHRNLTTMVSLLLRVLSGGQKKYTHPEKAGFKKNMIWTLEMPRVNGSTACEPPVAGGERVIITTNNNDNYDNTTTNNNNNDNYDNNNNNSIINMN